MYYDYNKDRNYNVYHQILSRKLLKALHIIVHIYYNIHMPVPDYEFNTSSINIGNKYIGIVIIFSSIPP